MEDVLPQLTYAEYVREILKRDPTIKQNATFHKINTQIKKDNEVCVVRFLNPHRHTGPQQAFYTNDAIDKFFDLYKKKVKRDHSGPFTQI